MRHMKKRILAAGLVVSFILSGCSLSDYNEGLDDANELVSGVVGAMNDIASEASSVMQDASPTASSIADEVKNSIDVVKDSGVLDEVKENVKENVKDSVKEAGEKATDAAKQSLKDAAKDVLNGASEDALTDAAGKAMSTLDEGSTGGILKSAADIELTNTDGSGKNYRFYYAGDEFEAIYTPDNWKVKNSYKIHSEADMIIICQALIDEHPVHGKDLVSYRTAEDMAYEWQIHNMGYAFFTDDENLRNKAKDVDFDPKDQGLTIEDFYESRTGKEFDVNVILGGG
jgi:gas vesicle protein